jgi:hypothetical protein
MSEQTGQDKSRRTTNWLLALLIIVVIVGGCCLCSVTPVGIAFWDGFIGGYRRGLEEGAIILVTLT